MFSEEGISSAKFWYGMFKRYQTPKVQYYESGRQPYFTVIVNARLCATYAIVNILNAYSISI